MEKDNYILSIDCDWVIDPGQHKKLLSYFIKKIKNVEEVYFSNDHQPHYNQIPFGSILVNIDNHHDLGFKDYQYKNLENGFICEASWILGLIVKRKIKGLIWVSNYQSLFSDSLEDNLKKVRQLYLFKRYFNVEDVENITYKKILVCQSFDFSKNSSYVYNSLIALSEALHKKILYLDELPNNKNLLQA